MLSSQSTIRKLRHQNKHINIQQLLNQTFSPKNIWREIHQTFSTIYMVCYLRNLIYYLSAGYAILNLKGMSNGLQAIVNTNELLSVMTVCKNAFHNGAMAYTC